MLNLLVMYSNFQPSPGHLERLRGMRGVGSVRVAEDDSSAREAASESHVILGHRYLWQVVPLAHQLRWVQSSAAGVDTLLTDEFRRRRPILSRCPIFSTVVASHAVALAWALSRGLPESLKAQQNGDWRTPTTILPLPSTACVIGVGEIGQEIARLIRPICSHTIGVARRSPGNCSGIDSWYGSDRWREALPQTDWCFLTIPGSPENRGFFDRAAIDALPPHALFVNVGRGETVDQLALAERLSTQRVGGAALDVTDPTPLPADHPLWKTSRLLITPKVGTLVPDRQPRLEAFVESQVQKYLAGEPLVHQVDYR